MMSRKFLLISWIGVLLMILSACAVPAAPGAAPAAPAPGATEAIEMEFWFGGTAARVEYMQAAVNEYNEMQDAIRINMIETPPSRERIATAISAGQGPDLMWYNHNMPWFFGIEAVYPLNDFITDPVTGIDADQLFPAFRQAVQYAGIVQAVPMHGCPGGLLYNRAIFAEAGLSDADAPTTWAEVEELAIRFTEREGDQVTQWGLVNGSIDWMLQELLLSNGGDWVSDDLSRYVSDPDALVEGLEWWRTLREDHEVIPVPSGVTWAGVEALQVGSEAFVRGDAAMSGFHGLCTAASLLDQNPDLDIAAVSTPLGPSANGQRTISPGFDGIFVMATNPAPQEGYLFGKWFFEEKALGLVRLSPGTVPATTAALDDPETQADPYLGFGSVIENMQTAKLRNFHVFPGRLDVRSQEPAMAESVMLGQATPEEAVERFLRHAEGVFDLYAEDLAEFLEDYAIVW
jgi:ABC-type glycerol-3-phosphate transport system substrate-binding protein